jgi:hypothetical protein
MPRIPEYIADCSVYLYASEDAAKRGQDAGGSGFLVHIYSSVPGYLYLYAVTNRHLIEDGFCVLRLNRKSGDTDNIVTTADDWFLHPEDDDVAVYPVGKLSERFKWSSVPFDTFADRESIETYNLGYGDEVFLVGRLIAQSGKQKNTPIVRFGNISLAADPTELIKYRGREQEAHLVECRSISGFSGSPVFIAVERWFSGEKAIQIWEYREKKHPNNKEEKPPPNTGITTKEGIVFMPWQFNVGPLLLGIDFGHIPHWDRVFQFPLNKKRRETDYKAESNTGIAGVVPSWKIIDILNAPKLADVRAAEDENLKKKLEETSDSFVEDAAHDAEPEFTQSDFEQALRKVSRRVESSQSDAEKK